MTKCTITRSVLLFVIIALGVPWIVQTLPSLRVIPTLPLSMLTPAFAAAICWTFIEKRSLWSKDVRSRFFGRWWYFPVVQLAVLGAAAATWWMSVQVHGDILLPWSEIARKVASFPGGSAGWRLGFVLALDLALGPILNVPIFLGEEIGWRGFLYPRLEELLGLYPSLFLGGVIWSLWHLPALIFGGLNYPNHPIIGTLFFMLLTVPLGAFLYIVYRWTNSMLVVSIAHGAANWGTIAASFFIGYKNIDPFKDGTTGIIAVIIWWIVAAIAVLAFARSSRASQRPTNSGRPA